MSPFACSADSVIAGVGLSNLISRPRALLLALSFGAFDAFASLLSTDQLNRFTWIDGTPGMFLLAWAGLALCQVKWATDARHASLAAFCLPPLLCVDNLLVPADPILAGLTSFAGALLGVCLGRWATGATAGRFSTPAASGLVLATAGIILLAI